MSEGHEPRDRPATSGESGETETEDGDGESRPRAELRRVRLREPRAALEIGRNGRVLDSLYREGHDGWEVLLETYEGD